MSSETSTKDGFSVGHFFILLSLLAATVAVLMARPALPESLILISLPHVDLDREPLSARLRADLEREKALTLRSIKELEFDRAMGKVSPQDFDQMASRLRARAMGIMQQLESGTVAYRVQVERDLAARLASTSRPDLQVGRAASLQPAGPSTPDLKVGPTGRSLRCACGTGNDPDARFCKACGTKLGTA